MKVMTMTTDDGTPTEVVVPDDFPTQSQAEVLKAAYKEHVIAPYGDWRGPCLAVVSPEKAALVREAMDFMGSIVDHEDVTADGDIRLASDGYWAHGF